MTALEAVGEGEMMADDKKQIVDMESLVGDYELTGVDRLEDVQLKSSWNHNSYYGEVMRIRLDDITYLFQEDENDGYRSYCEDIEIVDGLPVNMFAPVPVTVEYVREPLAKHSRSAEILRIRHRKTGGIIVEVGTDNVEDYYPIFVARYCPESLVGPVK